MAISFGPKIVTTGLIACFDPGNLRTYPGSGTTIYDACGNGYTGTLTNGASYSAVNGGVWVTDGVNDYVSISGINLTSSNYTIMGAARYTTVGGRLINALNNNWLMGHWAGSTENYYAAGWVSAVGAGPGDTNWRIYAATGDIGGDSYSFYVNGVLNAGPGNGGSAGPNGFSLGAYGGSSEFGAGHIGFLLVYNTILPVADILTNFAAMRGRYGL